jgi:hypothetical protein
MKSTIRFAAAAMLVPMLAIAAQVPSSDSAKTKTSAGRVAKDTSVASISLVPAIEIQHLRPSDQRGLNVFESPKDDGIPFTGFKLNIGAAFTQQFQSLKHSNEALPKTASGSTVNQNQLMVIGNGFNNAVANLNINAQLAKGIRVSMTGYLSSRHHQETWVKDGYLLVDDSPIDQPLLNGVMKYVTLKAGHFEINYGDSHFRRTDNGQGMYNPFVGNLILDPFTTEIGTEVYVRGGSFLSMVAVTAGEVKGSVQDPANRTPTVIGKLGFDRQFNPDVRVRLTASSYVNRRSPANTLYSGDRAGSRYYFVLENTTATSTAQKSSGMIDPGFSRKVEAYQVNPFIKVKGFEFFGVAERSGGRNGTETSKRWITQAAGDALYRFADDKLYVGGRYNVVEGKLAGFTENFRVNRVQAGAGWFVTPIILLKGEWVNQKYLDFPTTDIRAGGRFKGFMMEGTVAF